MRRWQFGRVALGVAAVGLTCALLGPAGPGRSAGAPDPAPDALQAALTDYAHGDWQNAWFRLWGLAHQGNAAAQFDLAQLYRFGKGIPADLALAFGWYAKAAAQGHGYAQYNLGVMYEYGQGTPRDLAEARAWYGRAAAQNIAGSEAAVQRLDRGEAPSDRR
jgi:TPR repeat protein